MNFEAKVFGKWILAGEHAVIRGSPALVFPLFSRALDIRYRKTSEALTMELKGSFGDELELLVWGVLEKACSLTGMKRAELTGQLYFSTEIPLGAGLGASAALCVAVAKLWTYLGYLKADSEYEFAQNLENLFHGESSGVDVAVALSAKGLHFERNGKTYSVEPQWKPRWYLSYTGQRGMTKDCVSKVKELFFTNAVRSEGLDQQMKEAVLLSEKALASSEKEGFPMLVEALKKARVCFDQWGLTDGKVGEHLQRLELAGASAVKPTGSGNGGFALSLWQNEPPPELKNELIPCF